MIDINKKYKTRTGCEVRIYATDAGGDYPIHGAVKCEGSDYWTLRKWSDSGSEYWTNSDELIEVSPYEDFKIDDKVLAWCEHGKKYKRYFAGVSDEGKPMTFPDGVTSWSTEDWDKEVWDYCEKVCDD